jgi:hypothetical protein
MLLSITQIRSNHIKHEGEIDILWQQTQVQYNWLLRPTEKPSPGITNYFFNYRFQWI